MARYIDADKLFRYVDEQTHLSKGKLQNYIRENHTADVDEVKHGHWIDVKDRLPENHEYVLCWYEYFRYGSYNRMYQTYGIGYCANGNWGGEVMNGTKCRVIAWQPLPEPPTERSDTIDQKRPGSI